VWVSMIEKSLYLYKNTPILLTSLQCYSKNASLSLKCGWAVPANAALYLCKTEDAEKYDVMRAPKRN